MNKLKQTAKTILIFILCFATCFLSIGCGEDITVEDGEYTAELVVNPIISWVETGFFVKIKNNELFVEDEYYGALSKGKISKNNLVDGDIRQYSALNNFDYLKLLDEKICLKSMVKDGICYRLMKYDDKKYLLRTAQDEKSDNFNIVKIWELVS